MFNHIQQISLTYDLKCHLLRIIKFTYPYHNLVTTSPTALFAFLLVIPFITELMFERVGTGHHWKRDESGHSSFGHTAALRLQEPPKAEKLRLCSHEGIWRWPFCAARWRVPGAQLSPLMCRMICWSHYKNPPYPQTLSSSSLHNLWVGCHSKNSRKEEGTIPGIDKSKGKGKEKTNGKSVSLNLVAKACRQPCSQLGAISVWHFQLSLRQGANQ